MPFARFVMPLLLLIFFCADKLSAQKNDIVPPSAKKLVACYPDFIAGYADNHLIFKDGSKLLWDDGISNKTYQQLLDRPDLKDMFRQAYSKNAQTQSPEKNFDPGRVRNEAFFRKIYGATKPDVEKNLVTVTWCPKTIGQQVKVTRLNSVAQQLQKVSAELDEHPELKKYLTGIGGTFNWRNIAGTHRLSLHSFGITVDINTKYSDYWQWTCKCTNEDINTSYQNRIPQIIIAIFEKHGFIWGGKWYHYDTMHFEYRPELLN
ncbi:M15 family metallopeptidase [Mucilaginibacter ximonensis]|uniref:M15 family metallopeptidase n=1 Tax=Mucilaginibacter ximonensis TaxID=538021 RepID=A0ABW5YEL4_9SPHI